MTIYRLIIYAITNIKRRKIGVLVANFKDVLFNRTNRPVLRQNNAPPKTPAPQAQPSRPQSQPYYKPC